jgi:hypothetical protein
LPDETEVIGRKISHSELLTSLSFLWETMEEVKQMVRDLIKGRDSNSSRGKSGGRGASRKS